MAQNIPMQRAMRIVKECRQMIDLHRTYAVNSELFRQESYSRWATDELLNRMRKHPDTPPLVIMEEFRDQMDGFSTYSQQSSLIFSTAKETAQWAIDLLLA